MKRWAVVTVLLYALALVLLTVPTLWLAFHKWSNHADSLSRYASLFGTWWYWLWLIILVSGQALLLLLPLRITERRFIPRRTLKIPCIVTAFLLANLFVAGIVDLLCAAYGDKVPDYYNLDASDRTGFGAILTAIVTLLFFWLVWNIVFRHFADSDDPDSLLKRTVRWLLGGSILELLIAVPSHVIVRRRDDCCAPMGTFWGIATGISIMLLCFGPGVYFLFAERFRRLQPRPAPADASI